MSGDLNDFLRQAAQRREARKRAEGQQSPPPPQTPAPPRPAAQSAPPKPPQAPVAPKPIGSPRPESSIEKADREREAHRQEIFGKQADKSPPKQPAPKANSPKSKQTSSKGQAAAPQSKSISQRNSQNDASNRPSVVESHSTAVDNQQLLRMLRDPRSLKMAFIASEIFNRKFD
jgi:hypothetical protein